MKLKSYLVSVYLPQLAVMRTFGASFISIGMGLIYKIFVLYHLNENGCHRRRIGDQVGFDKCVVFEKKSPLF